LAGRPSDYTGTSLPHAWDPIDPLPRVRAVPGIRLFVTGDAYDTDVDFGSQERYEQVAKTAANKPGLPIYNVGITYTDVSNGNPLRSALAAKERALATGSRVDASSIEAKDENRNAVR
jgi:hypothetical protein